MLDCQRRRELRRQGTSDTVYGVHHDSQFEFHTQVDMKPVAAVWLSRGYAFSGQARVGLRHTEHVVVARWYILEDLPELSCRSSVVISRCTFVQVQMEQVELKSCTSGAESSVEKLCQC